MKTYPQKDKGARTGSNLRSDHLRSNQEKLLAAQQKPMQRLAREYQRQCKKLFSKADLRLAAEISGRAEEDWRKANLQAGSDVAQWAARKKTARAGLDRLLARALPQYRQWQALRRKHLNEYRKLTDLSLQGLPAGRWDVIGPPPAGPVRSFIAPFNVYDIYTIDESDMIEEDQSVVTPTTGEIIHDLEFDFDENTPIIHGVFDLSSRPTASGLASCGVNFTMPQTGRLQVTAELQNHYNHVTLSLTDNFGFSVGKLNVTLKLFIAFVLPLSASQYSKVLFTETLTSDGDDTNSVMPDTEALYKWDRTSQESFQQGEVVQVLVGSEVYAATWLDDMRARAHAVLVWQLKRLTIGVV
jgi:hypothetical protein